MIIRKAQPSELGTLMEIYAGARSFMAETGNPDQWKDFYPTEEKIREDVERQACYVCVQGEEIEGVFSFLPGPDPTYQRIEGGQWLNDEPYAVVHRLAGCGQARGVADCCLDWAFARCQNLRIDTHRDNRVMRHILEKNGFVPCGIIYVADGSERIAFQKTAVKRCTPVNQEIEKREEDGR